jgi:glycosyltransferase involved in cell wall biosynthesis/peptidoglycan/xylan/chitin deacetylase (PgdA/CDA1 family)
MTVPAVSIVMAARNAEATIAQAIGSVRAQDFADWELLVVDDGSTDGTAAILDGYTDPRIRRFTGPAQGVSAARNLAIEQARGRWLGFLDSDDWFDPDFLSTMLAALAAAPDAGAVYCGYRRVLPDGAMTAPRIDRAVADAPFAAFARGCAVVTIHCLLVDRAQVVAMHGFDPALATCEDWDLWQRLSRAGMRWTMVDRALCYYRASAGSLTRAARAMLRDGRTVIDRGFAPDPRVSAPDPAFANGADPAQGGPDLAYGWFALWCLVVGALDGDPPPLDPSALSALPIGPDHAYWIADTIVQALVVGHRQPPAALARHWPALAPAIALAIDHVLAEREGHDLRLLYAVELLILYEGMDDPHPRPLDRTMRVPVRLDRPVAVAVPPGIDRVLLVFTDRHGHPVGTSVTGVLRDLSVSEVEALAAAHAPLRPLLRGLARRRPWALARAAIPRALRHFRADRDPRRWPLRHLARDIARRTAPRPGDVAALAAQALARAAAIEQPAPQAPARLSAPPEADRTGDRRAFWEGYFAHKDPWNYGSPYEQEKYRRQLDLLPDPPVGRALELACAEGFFTRLLAPRVTRLTATDISATAVERARARCAEHTNIDWRTLDLSADPIPGDQDLIVCSEVLYYLADTDELRCVLDRIVAALAPGGSLLTAHAFVVADDRARTGFDWANPFGARRIAETLDATPGLHRAATIETELYRIDRYQRTATNAPMHRHLPVEAPIEDAVARSIVWGGAPALRREVTHERTRRLPILMYHSIAADGPAALARWRTHPDRLRDQLRWLRANGYHALTAAQADWYWQRGQPFEGRPVWITFDDGNADFARHGWPLLRAHDFRAEMFVVTDAIGGRAEWDAGLADPLPLLDAGQIATLAGEGVSFGSHFARHRAADTLSTADLASELLDSRAVLERLTGRAPLAFAAPFMAPDLRLPDLARRCGYALGMIAGSGVAHLSQPPLDLPRIEVRGDWSLDDFVAAIEAARA